VVKKLADDIALLISDINVARLEGFLLE
jgi:hypothetical protein